MPYSPNDLVDERDLLFSEATEGSMPDPALWQRLVGVLVGVAAYAVVVSLGLILITSRVPSPFTWIPGFAILAVGVLGFRFARGSVLSAFGVNSVKAEIAKPVRWLTTSVVVVAAVLAQSVLYIFLLVATPMNGLQGEYGMNVLEALQSESQAVSQDALSPMRNDLSEDAFSEVVQLIASGEMSRVPEERKFAAVAGNWDQAFGVPATVADVEYVRSVALLIEDDVRSGVSCGYFDDVFEYLAQDFQADRGRTEYVFSAGIMAWTTPETALRMIDCLS